MDPTTANDGEAVAALDELFGAITRYRTSEGFLELLEFLRRLPDVGPYNALLLHIQRPGVTEVATVSGWQRRGRRVKRNANPLVTLRPFGPVAFVYDVMDTVGPKLPEDIADPFRTQGRLSPAVFERTRFNTESDQIAVVELEFGSSLAGKVSRQRPDREQVTLSTDKPAELIVDLNKELALEARYATLVHELAHVYCGHLGVSTGAWWTSRRQLGLREREFEAESVSWIVCSRIGLDPGSYRYLEAFLRPGQVVPDASLNQIMTAANHIEMLGRQEFRRKRGGKAKVSTLASDRSLLSVHDGKPYDEETGRLVAEILEELNGETDSDAK